MTGKHAAHNDKHVSGAFLDSVVTPGPPITHRLAITAQQERNHTMYITVCSDQENSVGCNKMWR